MMKRNKTQGNSEIVQFLFLYLASLLYTASLSQKSVTESLHTPPVTQLLCTTCRYLLGREAGSSSDGYCLLTSSPISCSKWLQREIDKEEEKDTVSSLSPAILLTHTCTAIPAAYIASI